LISTIIPVYNGERYLAETLASALAQDYPRQEVIVVDDGSTDSTAAIVQAHPTVRYLHQPNQGHGAAKNTGITAATGDYLAFLDADDLWAPGKLSRQIEHLRANPGALIAICLMEMLLEEGMAWPAAMNEAHYRQLPPAYLPSALIAHRRAFEQIGLFSLDFWHTNDSDWFFRARDAGLAILVAPHVLLHRRLHHDNLTHQAGAINAELLHVVRASVLRTRGEGRENSPVSAASPDRLAP
jgi:glycosyltransferase involved in cell wall biosynthesis